MKINREAKPIKAEEFNKIMRRGIILTFPWELHCRSCDLARNIVTHFGNKDDAVAFLFSTALVANFMCDEKKSKPKKRLGKK